MPVAERIAQRAQRVGRGLGRLEVARDGGKCRDDSRLGVLKVRRQLRARGVSIHGERKVSEDTEPAREARVGRGVSADAGGGGLLRLVELGQAALQAAAWW